MAKNANRGTNYSKEVLTMTIKEYWASKENSERVQKFYGFYVANSCDICKATITTGLADLKTGIHCCIKCATTTEIELENGDKITTA